MSLGDITSESGFYEGLACIMTTQDFIGLTRGAQDVHNVCTRLAQFAGGTATQPEGTRTQTGNIFLVLIS